MVPNPGKHGIQRILPRSDDAWARLKGKSGA